jgi:K+-sensing histidine kinase KdpD
VGLGLVWARRIVTHHGGAITVGTGRLGGARFQVIMPAAP